MAKVICQNCGAEVILPEHECVKTGLVIGEDTNGTFIIPTKNTKGEPMEQKMDRATLDVIKSAMGDAAYNALVEKIGLDNPIVQNIIESGDLECGVDYHRWVLKQMTEMEFGWYKNWTKAFNAKVSYMNQFDDYLAKLKKIAHLKKQGKLNAMKEELQFISKDDIRNLMYDYIKRLRTQISEMKTKTCKKVPYYEFERKDFYGAFPTEQYGNMVFTSDIERKIFSPLVKVYEDFKYCDSVEEMYKELLKFTNKKYFINIKGNAHHKPFVNNYKGYGAYFGLKDSIRFFGVRCTDYSTGQRILDRDASLAYLEKCKDYALSNNANYQLLALLEQSWKDSGFTRESYRKMVGERRSE